ncbi:MAG: thioredoxin domain-containing protein [Bacteroidia bacterium]|nr:thioredoxin domain-containing protein [Bacteroidia bacterium]
MNHLIGQKSLYLQAHARQPVDWYPWGEDAFQKAWTENKPIIISIGYSSCHWCHVMSRECFEDREVARLMNQYFVCIKVDREERPDVDQLYMDSIVLTGRPGGWPLNCFALPDGRPFYGVTYLPKKQWVALLKRIHQLYTEKPEEVREMARKLSEAIQQIDAALLSVPADTTEPLPWDEIIRKLLEDTDWIHGGAWGAQKFPTPGRWIFYLRAGILLSKPELLRAAHLTLQKMALGGLFDPLEGGFMRYCTDRQWRIPHFEKMLYDNAWLLALYSEAYRQQPTYLYEQVIRQTVHFLLERMRLPNGLFAASLSAESENEEGKFYAWRFEELERVLTDPKLKQVFLAAYEVSPEGNWEHGLNILYRGLDDESIAQRLGLSVEEVSTALREAHEQLRQVRAQRIPPDRDEAAIISWNAYTIIGLVEAYKALAEPAYLYAAQTTAHTLLSAGTDLHRIQREDYWYGEAFAEDYAALITALIHLYTVTANEEYLLQSRQLLDKAIELFYDSNEGLFCFTASSFRFFPVRRKDIFDTSTPSSNSLFAEALWYLARYFQDDSYQQKFDLITQRMRRPIVENPSLAYHLLKVVITNEKAPFSLIHRGGDFGAFWKMYEPLIGWTAYLPIGESRIPSLLSYAHYKPGQWFLCTKNACLPPVSSLEALQQLLAKEKARLSGA